MRSLLTFLADLFRRPGGIPHAERLVRSRAISL